MSAWGTYFAVRRAPCLASAAAEGVGALITCSANTSMLGCPDVPFRLASPPEPSRQVPQHSHSLCLPPPIDACKPGPQEREPGWGSHTNPRPSSLPLLLPLPLPLPHTHAHAHAHTLALGSQTSLTLSRSFNTLPHLPSLPYLYFAIPFFASSLCGTLRRSRLRVPPGKV